MTALMGLLTRYWQVAAGLAAALGVLLYGRNQRGAGAVEKETKLRAEANAAQLEAVKNVEQTVRDIRSASDAQRERVRGKWTRDD